MMAKIKQPFLITLMVWFLSAGVHMVQAQDTVYIGAPEHSRAVIVGEPGQSSRTESSETLTERWLHIQGSSQAASGYPQQATPRERELANQRLLDSYQHPIPEFFEQDQSGKIAR